MTGNIAVGSLISSILVDKREFTNSVSRGTQTRILFQDIKLSLPLVEYANDHPILFVSLTRLDVHLTPPPPTSTHNYISSTANCRCSKLANGYQDSSQIHPYSELSEYSSC
ncbi:hypothetical protein CDAR_575691 [Caerostris darwini]|uniref:Uncharacterized protein n=1 Tax=Caerostris darwini TaxID=1538125 RepID=A0AAV4MU69_9ARAC|nr:hypothetical protein CDAR_575691 [Caerostris darwini]